MGFDWKLYITLSDELITHQRDRKLKKAYLRTALSRYYYGVYGLACNLIKSEGIALPQFDKHKFVRNYYSYSSDVVRRKIGSNLSRLWKRRINADYDENAKIDMNEAKTSQSHAIATLKTLSRIGFR